MAIYKGTQEVKDLYLCGHGIANPSAVGLQEDVDYVRYEWLRFYNEPSTQSVYTFMSLPIESSDVKFELKYNIISNSSYFTTGNSRYSYGLSNEMLLVRVWDYSQNNVVYTKNNSDPSNTSRIIESTGSMLTINGESVTKYGFPIDACVWKNNGTIDYLTSAITVNGSVRYIPCRLLRPIPAALDANGIARNSGECGMFDAESGKFYGNVAASGEFSVEGLIQHKIRFAFMDNHLVFGKLVEGDDFVRAQWLKGDGSSYIDTGIIVPTEKFVCITKLRNREKRTVPTAYFAFTVRQIQSAAVPYISVNPRTDEQRYYVDLTVPRSYVPFGSGEFDINITMPSASTLQGDLMFFRSRNVNFGNSPWIGDIAAFLLTSLDSTFRVEMQPCRLLRAIPAELDANGIARPADTCGMYNIVNGLFYGNVAPGGTFTVENDAT